MDNNEKPKRSNKKKISIDQEVIRVEQELYETRIGLSNLNPNLEEAKPKFEKSSTTKFEPLSQKISEKEKMDLAKARCIMKQHLNQIKVQNGPSLPRKKNEALLIQALAEGDQINRSLHPKTNVDLAELVFEDREEYLRVYLDHKKKTATKRNIGDPILPQKRKKSYLKKNEGDEKSRREQRIWKKNEVPGRNVKRSTRNETRERNEKNENYKRKKLLGKKYLKSMGNEDDLNLEKNRTNRNSQDIRKKLIDHISKDFSTKADENETFSKFSNKKYNFRENTKKRREVDIRSLGGEELGLFRYTKISKENRISQRTKTFVTRDNFYEEKKKKVLLH